jgi:hypothetical protein
MTNKQKQEYNNFVYRLKQAALYMDDDSIPIEEREKHMPRLRKLMQDMHDIAKEFKLTEEEMLNGIRII